jgi:TrmH family RNA methyltransferase
VKTQYSLTSLKQETIIAGRSRRFSPMLSSRLLSRRLRIGLALQGLPSMPFRIVQSKHNPRLKQLRRALIKPLRQPLDGQGGEGRLLAGIEGPNLLEEALRAGLSIHCVFVAQGAEHLLEALTLAPGTEVLVLPKTLLDSVLATDTPQPIAALLEPPNWTWAHFLGGHRKTPSLVLVLAGLQDPGNLGAILRSAEAFGANGVISLPGTVSAWNPKAVRASAGSVFRLPLLELGVEECFMHLREAGIKVWTTAVRGAEPADLVNLTGPVALLIGNEGNGVPDGLAAEADGALTILCPGAVESLNAPVAASILLYEAARQRACRSAPLELRGGLR